GLGAVLAATSVRTTSTAGALPSGRIDRHLARPDGGERQRLVTFTVRHRQRPAPRASRGTAGHPGTWRGTPGQRRTRAASPAPPNRTRSGDERSRGLPPLRGHATRSWLLPSGGPRP